MSPFITGQMPRTHKRAQKMCMEKRSPRQWYEEKVWVRRGPGVYARTYPHRHVLWGGSQRAAGTDAVTEKDSMGDLSEPWGSLWSCALSRDPKHWEYSSQQNG